MQLDIFSEITEIAADAWEKLAALDFNGAENLAGEALSRYPDNENARLCLTRSNDWSFLDHSGAQVSDILRHITKYPFTDWWGDEKFRVALLNRVIAMVTESGEFKVDEFYDLAHVYLLKGDLTSAESVLEKYLNANPVSGTHQLRLANISWSAGKISKANFLYMLTFFSFPDKILVSEVEHTVLQKLATIHTIPMSVPWSLLYGQQMPLAAAAKFTAHSTPEIAKAARACVAMADDQAARVQRKTSVEARKLLAECDRGLFDAYMRFMQSGRPLSF
jgi:tetratricopeptide (TPR) repeat protein